MLQLNKTKAVVYTRVSTDKDEQKTSLQFQQEYYTKFCDEIGYILVDVFADEGLSGTNSKRDNFLKMLFAAGLDIKEGSGKLIHFDKSNREPLFNLIIVKDVTRFSRNLDTVRPIKLLKEMGVHILFENNNLNTKDDDYQTRLGFYLMFAENESRDKSDKMKWTLKHKARQGKFHFSRLPYGYKKQDDEYILNDNEAEVIRKMYDLYVNENKGFDLIAHYLNENSIPNKEGITGKWTSSGVNRIISSERNIGTVVLQRISNGDITGSGSRIKNEKEKWTRIEGAIPAIIDKETWLKAQQIREERVQVMADNSKRGKKLSEDFFYHKIKCNKCGSHFTRVVTNKVRGGKKVRETTYFCYKRRKHKQCDMRGVSYNVLERELFKAIQGVKDRYTNRSKDEELDMAIAIEDVLDEKEKNAEERIKQLNDEINEINTKIDEVSDAFIKANAKMADALNRKIDSLEEEKQELQKKILSYDLTAIKKKREIVAEKYCDIVDASEREFKTLEEIISVLDHIEVKEGKELIFHFKLHTLFDLYMEEVEFEGDIIELLKTKRSYLLHWNVKY